MPGGAAGGGWVGADPVHLLVVADACTDETAAVAAACGAQVIGITARNVGMARAVGMAGLLEQMADTDPAAGWLATTDADTVVPPGWLRRQLSYANQGWDVVLRTVTVTDWDEHPPHIPALFAAMYEFGEGPHPHVHGANLGIRAPAYLVAGGFKPLQTAEDHALIAAAAECRMPGPAGQRHQRADVSKTSGARAPRIQPPAANTGPRTGRRRQRLLPRLPEPGRPDTCHPSRRG